MLAVLSMSAGDYLVSIVDVSRTGARVCGDVLPSVGQHVNFRAENVHAAAFVVWCERGTCALEFDTPIAISEVQRLRWLGIEVGSL
jgi:hypothetical protein